jgi:hypothetical protein
MTSHAYLIKTEGVLTQGWRPGRNFGESVGGIPKTKVLIGRTGLKDMSWIPDLTLTLTWKARVPDIGPVCCVSHTGYN